MLMRQKKCVFLISILIILLSIGMVWAAGDSEGQAKKISLVHYGHTQPPFDGLIERNINQFMEDNPNITVEYAIFADPDLPNQILTSIAGGTPPNSFTIAGSNAARFLEKGQLATIDPTAFGKQTVEEVVAMWQPGAFEGAGGYFKGEYYGIPHELSNYCAWINGKHMVEAGLDPEKDIPKTWEEFIDVAKKLTVDKDGVRVRNGFGVNLRTAGFVANVSYPLLLGAGAGIVDANITKSLLDTPEAARAVRLFTDWILEDKIWDPGLVTDDREGFGNELQSSFFTGGAWYWGVMASQYPDTYDDAIVFPYPRFADGADVGGISYGYSTYVVKSAPNQKEAWMVADAIASTPDDFIKEGLFQPRIGYSQNIAQEYLPSWDVFGAELVKATPRPMTQYYQEIIDIYYKAVTQIVYDNVEVEAALEVAAKKINELIQN